MANNFKTESQKEVGKEMEELDFFQQLKLRCQEKRENGEEDDSDSCFSASSSSACSEKELFQRQPVLENPLPLYRKEYGGIVIYDVDAIMVGEVVRNISKTL